MGYPDWDDDRGGEETMRGFAAESADSTALGAPLENAGRRLRPGRHVTGRRLEDVPAPETAPIDNA